MKKLVADTTTEGAFTFNRIARAHGSNQTKIEVDRNGRPWGMVWTFRNTRTETHPWHAKALNGEHKAFYEADGGLRAAMDFIKG